MSRTHQRLSYGVLYYIVLLGDGLLHESLAWLRLDRENRQLYRVGDLLGQAVMSNPASCRCWAHVHFKCLLFPISPVKISFLL